METKMQHFGKLDEVDIYFDPLRKSESFIVLLKDNKMKMGYTLNDDIVFESNANIIWNNVTSIIGGFSNIETFERIKNKINEENK